MIHTRCCRKEIVVYTKGKSGLLKHIDFIILDICCLEAAFLLAGLIRFGGTNPYAMENYLNMALLLVLGDLVGAYLFNTFKNVLRRGYYLEFAATLKHTFLLAAVVMFYLFGMQEGATYSRIFVFLMFGIYLVLSYGTRLLWKLYITTVRKVVPKRSMLIVTTDSMAQEVILNLKKDNYEDIKIAGVAIVNKDLTGTQVLGLDVVANADDVVDYVCRSWIDEVFISVDGAKDYPRELLDKFLEMGVVVHMGVSLRETVSGSKVLVEKLGGYHVLTSTINYATPFQAFAKRGLDILGGFVGCLITALLFVILGPIIYISSPGPIFFAQNRVGKNGKIFKIYKFRSMYMDAEERKKELMEQNRVKDGMMFKMDFDPRIIGSKILPDGTQKKGIGNIIRDFSLDEFPQFFNVLKGDMSLVGTRPPTLDEWDKYELHHRARLATKPGITGMWQVSGRSKITDFEEVVKLDTQYITNWSMGLDMKILLKTVLVVLGRDGSM